jgi:hypothetical protein
MFRFFTSNSRQLDEMKRQQNRKLRSTESEVCAMVARGNISLQQGEYVTQEDMDTLQNELKDYFFSEKSKW